MPRCSYEVYVRARVAHGAPLIGFDRARSDEACPWSGPRAARFAALARGDVDGGIPARSKVHVCRQCRALDEASQAAGLALPAPRRVA